MVVRSQVLPVVVILVMITGLAFFITYLECNRSMTLVINEGRVLANSVGWYEIPVEEEAEWMDIRLDYRADEEFDVWLCLSSDIGDMSPFILGPPRHIRHGVAGSEPVEWSVDMDEVGNAGLTIVEDNMFWGARGTMTGSDTIYYTGEREYSSRIDPMNTTAYWVAISLLVATGLVVAYFLYLPREREVVDVWTPDPQHQP